MAELSDYQRGLKEGAVDALLGEHTQRLNKINGSVERHAKSNETLAREMRDGFEKVAFEIRSVQEEARLERERARVAAETVAAVSAKLRDSEAGAWSLRSDKASVAYLVIALVAVAVAVYTAFH